MTHSVQNDLHLNQLVLQVEEMVTPAAKKPKLEQSPTSMFSPGAPGNTPGNLARRRVQPLSMLNPYDGSWTIKVISST